MTKNAHYLTLSNDEELKYGCISVHNDLEGHPSLTKPDLVQKIEQPVHEARRVI